MRLKPTLFRLRVLLWFSYVCVSHSARILAVFPMPTISHQAVYQPIWRELSLRGHQVTVLTSHPLRDSKLTNLTEIEVISTHAIIRKHDITKKLSKNNYIITNVLKNSNFLKRLVEEDIKFSENIIKDPNVQFDLMLVENFHPLIYGYACRFKVPVIGLSSGVLFLYNHDAVGNPTHPSLNLDMLLNFVGEIGLYRKAYSAFYNIWYRVLYHWYILPQTDKLVKKYFGEDCPYLGDLERNLSLMLVNTNPVLHTVRPMVPAVIQIGQMHLSPKKPLPPHLQDYLDKSTQGVIYFSLGSAVESTDLEENMKIVIIEALSELPYNVLLKWQSDYLPKQPKNVMIQKWFPQQDVLGHKNIKTFVTQGGLQSIEEAVTNGVPLVGMPFFIDQPANIRKMVEIGTARSIDYTTMTKDSLKEVIIDVAENDKYRNKMMELREIVHDHPMNGLEKAIWWIEYVLRHGTALEKSYSGYALVRVFPFRRCRVCCSAAGHWLLSYGFIS